MGSINISSHCPLFSMQHCWLTSATATIFLKKIMGTLRIEPGAAGTRTEASVRTIVLCFPLRYILPQIGWPGFGTEHSPLSRIDIQTNVVLKLESPKRPLGYRLVCDFGATRHETQGTLCTKLVKLRQSASARNSNEMLYRAVCSSNNCDSLHLESAQNCEPRSCLWTLSS